MLKTKVFFLFYLTNQPSFWVQLGSQIKLWAIQFADVTYEWYLTADSPPIHCMVFMKRTSPCLLTIKLRGGWSLLVDMNWARKVQAYLTGPFSGKPRQPHAHWNNCVKLISSLVPTPAVNKVGVFFRIWDRT